MNICYSVGLIWSLNCFSNFEIVKVRSQLLNLKIIAFETDKVPKIFELHNFSANVLFFDCFLNQNQRVSERAHKLPLEKIQHEFLSQRIARTFESKQYLSGETVQFRATSQSVNVDRSGTTTTS